jgi:hypothetical protein
MRIARKLALLAMLAVAATALGPPSAPAQTEPLIHDQVPQLIVQTEVHGATDANCPLVTPSPAPNPGPLVTAGGCRSHLIGNNIELYAHLPSGGTHVLISKCNYESDIRVDAAGEGFLSHQELTAPSGGGSCTRRPCGQTVPGGEGRAYSFYMHELEPAPTEKITVLFCNEALDGSTFAHCEVTFPFGDAASHAYRFSAIDVSGHGGDFPHCEYGSALNPANFDTESFLQSTGEGQTETRLEIRHQ